MSVSLNVNGTVFSYPSENDSNWATAATGWAQAVTAGMLQKAGGSFTLTSEVDFGASYGLKSLYYKSRTANVASAGQIRLARADTVSWRNQANSADLDLGVNSSNALTFGGTAVAVGNFLPLAGGTLTGQLINTRSGNSAGSPTVLLNPGTGTDATLYGLNSTGGAGFFGIESSIGGTLTTGSTAYATIVGSSGATPFHLITNNVVRGTVSSTGDLTWAGGGITTTKVGSVGSPSISVSPGTGTSAGVYGLNNSGAGVGFLGLESSTGGSLISGTSAYALVLGTTSTRALQIATNNTLRGTVSTAGDFTWASGQYLNPSGTAALPSFSFSGDPNTGVYNPSADALGFATNGVLRGSFTSTGAFRLQGTTSGTLDLLPAATTTSYSLTLPSAAPSVNGQVLSATTAGVASWTTVNAITVPTVQTFTATGTTTGYLFTVTAANATVGATYTNNGNTYTVLATIAGATELFCSQASAPTASGTLTKASGTGDATITFSANRAIATYTTPANVLYVRVQMVGGGGGGAASGGAGSGAAGTGTYFGAGIGKASPGLGGGTTLGGAGGTFTVAGAGTNLGSTDGADGAPGSNVLVVSYGVGGNGGQSVFGGAGPGGSAANGLSAKTNSGSGGGGNGSATGPNTSGGGGGAGAYAEFLITPSAAQTFAYAVGAAGGGGSGGGNGAAGKIIVTEYYQ